MIRAYGDFSIYPRNSRETFSVVNLGQEMLIIHLRENIGPINVPRDPGKVVFYTIEESKNAKVRRDDDMDGRGLDGRSIYVPDFVI